MSSSVSASSASTAGATWGGAVTSSAPRRALAVASATIGGTHGAFAAQTNEGLNAITARPDFRGPTVSPVAIGRSTGYATGYIRNASTYYIYANVTDVGTPPSGTATVSANVANVTAGGGVGSPPGGSSGGGGGVSSPGTSESPPAS